MDDATHYLEFARAFVRGRLGLDRGLDDDALWTRAAAAERRAGGA